MDSEIDLIELVVKFIKFSRKNFKFICLFSLVGIIISFVMCFSQGKKAQAELLFKSEVLPAKVVEKIIYNISTTGQVASNGKEDKFNINKYNIISKVKVDTLDKKNVNVTFILKDTSGYQSMKYSFINSINNDPYIYKCISNFVDSRRDYLKELEKKILELDSVQKGIKDNIYEGSRNYGNVDPNYKEYFYLYQKKLDVINELKLVQDGNKLNGIYLVSEKLQLKRISLFIYIGVVIFSIFLGYFVLFIVKVWKLSKN